MNHTGTEASGELASFLAASSMSGDLLMIVINRGPYTFSAFQINGRDSSRLGTGALTVAHAGIWVRASKGNSARRRLAKMETSIVRDLNVVVTADETGAEQCRCTLGEFCDANQSAWPARLWRTLPGNIAERIRALGSDVIDCGSGGVFTIKAAS